jgi:hypothetical protein
VIAAPDHSPEGAVVARRRKQPTRWQGLMLLCVGVVGLPLIGIMTLSQQVFVSRLVAVQGSVVSKRIVQAGVRQTLFKPVIEYTYVVDGVTYRNQTFSPLQDEGTEEWARSVLQDYRVNAPCTVYIASGNPRTSVLSSRPSAESTWRMMGGLVLGLIGTVYGWIVFAYEGI